MSRLYLALRLKMWRKKDNRKQDAVGSERKL